MLKVKRLVDGFKEDSRARPVPSPDELPLCTTVTDDSAIMGVAVDSKGTSSSMEVIELVFECRGAVGVGGECLGAGTWDDENQDFLVGGVGVTFGSGGGATDSGVGSGRG